MKENNNLLVNDLYDIIIFHNMTKKDPLKYHGAHDVILCLNEPKQFTNILILTKLNPTTLNRRLINLIDTGYINKIIDSKDKRVKYELTDNGRKTFNSLKGINKFSELSSELFGFKLFKESPIVEVLGKIAQYYKENPDKAQNLEKSKNEVIDKLADLLTRIFNESLELEYEIQKEHLVDLLEEGWKLLIELWAEKKEEK